MAHLLNCSVCVYLMFIIFHPPIVFNIQVINKPAIWRVLLLQYRREAIATGLWAAVESLFAHIGIYFTRTATIFVGQRATLARDDGFGGCLFGGRINKRILYCAAVIIRQPQDIFVIRLAAADAG